MTDKEEVQQWKRLYEERNQEWIRVLTAYFPDMKLEVYSPQAVAEWFKAQAFWQEAR